MYKLVIFVAIAAVAHAGIIAPVVPLAHPVAHRVAVAPVAVAPVAVSHSSTLVHHTPVVAAPIVPSPIVHAPVVPIVKHSPYIAVHH